MLMDLKSAVNRIWSQIAKRRTQKLQLDCKYPEKGQFQNPKDSSRVETGR